MPADLAELQRWFQQAMLDDAPPADADRVVTASQRLTAGQRLDLYRRGYRLRLLETLRDTHPALRHALGSEVFDAFALDYLDAHPSRSYTLFRLSEGFAAHLAATRPSGELWPDFVIDLARLERIFLEVYEGPGTEGEPAAAEQHDRIEPAPCLRLLHSRYPVGPYLQAVRRGQRPPIPAPVESFLAVSRRDYVVTLTPLDAHDYAALDSLMRGEPPPGNPRTWIEHGLVVIR